MVDGFVPGDLFVDHIQRLKSVEMVIDELNHFGPCVVFLWKVNGIVESDNWEVVEVVAKRLDGERVESGTALRRA